MPPRLIEAARLNRGARILDVACGTGVLTVEAAKAVSPGGAAVGVDLNSGMLAVTQQHAPIDPWCRSGCGRDAAALAVSALLGAAEPLVR
jgi:SAM-dependent methyltransferase